MLFLGTNTILHYSSSSSHYATLVSFWLLFVFTLFILSPNSPKTGTKMVTKRLRCCANFLENSKHHFAMIALQFGYAGMNIITKVSLNRGMSHYVLVVYRHAFATAVIAPFAFIFERFICTFLNLNNKSIATLMLMSGSNFHRKAQPRITFKIFMQIFILALLGLVPSFYIYRYKELNTLIL